LGVGVRVPSSASPGFGVVGRGSGVWGEGLEFESWGWRQRVRDWAAGVGAWKGHLQTNAAMPFLVSGLRF